MKSALVALALLPSAALAQVSSKEHLDLNCIVLAASMLAPEAIKPEVRASIEIAIAGAIMGGIPHDNLVERALAECAANPQYSLWGVMRRAAQAE